MKRFYDDDTMNFAVLLSLGFAYHGIADVGETLAVVENVPDGDKEAWITEWTKMADRLGTEGEDAAKHGHSVSARSKLLRASTYYDHASSMSPGTSDPSRYDSLWEKHRHCWDRAVTFFDPPVEQIEIPYEDTTLAGYFFSGGTDGSKRPTIILNNGSDGPVISMWSLGGRSAVMRGWNAITFDGPGQGAALHRQGLYFRYDWEKVVTPVIDYLLTRGDVDTGRIALQGVSQAGYWAPRAAAFEDRICALVADPGVMRVGDSWTAHLPKVMLDLLDAGEKEQFNTYMNQGMDEAMRAMLAWRMAPYGAKSPFEAYTAARKMSLDAATVGQITCPTLVLDPEDEQFWAGQSQEMFDALTCSKKKLAHFTRDQGANWHCEPAAQSLRDEMVFDWLEEVT